MKFAVLTVDGSTWITDADSISDACEKFDWKYPGTVVSVMQLMDDHNTTCPYCGAEMREES